MTSHDAVATVAEGCGTFPATHWTAILAAGQSGSDEVRRELEEFCGRYWDPVFRHVRWLGYAAADAEDLTQQFFARLVEKKTLASVTQEGGRFRSFLLAALGNFLANEWRRGQAAKRGGGARLEELDGWETTARENAALQPSGDPAAAFDRDWADTVLRSALTLVQEEYRREKNGALFEQLRPFLTGASEAQPYRAIAQTLQTTEANVKVLVHRLRRRFGAVLRQEIAATVSSPDQIQEEIRYLAEIAGGPPKTL